MAETGSLSVSRVAFRDATPADAAALGDLGRATFAATFGHLYKPADLATFLTNHDLPKWQAALADPAQTVRIGEADGRAVAYARVTPPALPIELPPGRAALELKQFYLLGDWHGQGVADELMRWVLATAKARGAEDLYLSVFVDNNRARRFYARYGFELIGQWAFMVGDHADEDYILRLRLDA